MLDMAKRKSPVTTLEDAPDWMKELKGYDGIALRQNPDGSESASFSDGTDETYASGTWRSEVSLPNDLDDLKDHIDPLLVLMGLSAAAEHLDNKLTDVVRYCRADGKTWTQIGASLGMSKQAAWERFSGED